MAASFEKTCIVTRADAIDLTDARTEALLALPTLLAGEGFGFRRLLGEPPSEEPDDAEAPPAPGVLELTLDVAESAPIRLNRRLTRRWLRHWRRCACGGGIRAAR